MQIPQYTKKMYNQMMRHAVSMRPTTPMSIYHNSHRVKEFGKMGPRTFEGFMACGQMTYCLAPILYGYGYRNIKLLYSRMGYGRHLEDHLHFLINGRYVVDPTWRQFFNGRIYNNPQLSRYLYDDNHPIFIGTYKDLYKTICKAIAHTDIRHEVDKAWIHSMWMNTQDVTKRLSVKMC